VIGWRLTWLCYFGGHQEPVWAVESKGHGWRCPDCQRFRVSQVYRAR
jgi:hypothetical protein